MQALPRASSDAATLQPGLLARPVAFLMTTWTFAEAAPGAAAPESSPPLRNLPLRI